MSRANRIGLDSVKFLFYTCIHIYMFVQIKNVQKLYINSKKEVRG